MIRYKVIDHPSDTGIEAFGKDKKELFENAAYGMMDLMFEIKGRSPVFDFAPPKITLSADNVEALLVAWLSEIIYITDTHKVCLYLFEIKELSDNQLEAMVAGGRIIKVKTGIKAVTFSQMKIEQTKGVWHTRIIFDV